MRYMWMIYIYIHKTDWSAWLSVLWKTKGNKYHSEISPIVSPDNCITHILKQLWSANCVNQLEPKLTSVGWSHFIYLLAFKLISPCLCNVSFYELVNRNFNKHSKQTKLKGEIHGRIKEHNINCKIMCNNIFFQGELKMSLNVDCLSRISAYRPHCSLTACLSNCNYAYPLLGWPPLHESHLPLESLRLPSQLSWKQGVRQAHCPPLNAINIQPDLSSFLGEAGDGGR